MSRYKRQTRLKVGEVPALVKAATEAKVSAAEAAAQTLMTYAQFHLDEAEKFQHAARILRGDTPREFAGEADEREEKRLQWREAKRQARANSNINPRAGRNAHGKPVKSGYWAKMSPLQRQREMAHRLLVREGKAEPRRRAKRSKVVRPLLRMPMGGVA
jgi:hypothetical protein